MQDLENAEKDEPNVHSVAILADLERNKENGSNDVVRQIEQARDIKHNGKEDEKDVCQSDAPNLL